MRSRNGLVLLALLWSSACSDDPTGGPAPLRPQASHQQVADAGFTFLPPLIADAQKIGVFNPNLEPAVEVCLLAGGACSELTARLEFTGDLATGVRVQPELEQYEAHFRLPTSTGTGAAVPGSYRITVRSGPAASASALGTLDVLYTTDGRVTHLDGTLISQGNTPVRFFISYDIHCSTREPDNPEGEPCLVATVGPEGGTFTVESREAGTFIPPAALSETVTLIIERYEPPAAGGEDPYEYACLPVYHPQYEGCYTFRTEPEVENFDVDVVVGICPDPAALPIEAQLELWKWDEEDPSSVVELPRENVEFLECEGFDAAPGENPVRRLSWTQRLLRPLAHFLAPRPLHARGVSPFGGKLGDFSRVGWVRPLALQVVSGDGQSGYVGLPLPADVTVRVVSNGEKVVGQDIPIPGVSVQFTPAAGSGTAVPATASTDAGGLASTVWTPGSVGVNALAVHGTNPLAGFPNLAGTWSVPPHGAPAEFTATGVALPPPPPPARYRVVFRSPVEQGQLGPKAGNVPGVPVTVLACHQLTQQCWTTRRIVSPTEYHFQWRTEGSMPAGAYTFGVLEGNTVLGSFTGAVAKDGSAPKNVDFAFELNSTVQIRFLLVAK